MSQNLPLISVIVPVYNVEDYIEQCVKTLAAQAYPNLEIILVDDGATDSSGSICDRLGATFDRVVVFHKENGGLSDARNYGLARSHGEWISFVDSDDYVSPIFISTLYQAAVECDCPIAAVPGGKDFRDGEPCGLLENNCPAVAVPLNAHEAQRLMLYQQIDTGTQWRLYRRDTLNEDPFPKGLYYEDLASTYKFVHAAERIALVNCRELYAYRLRSASIIRQSYRHVKGYSAVTVASQLYHDISEWYPTLADAAASRCFSVCRMVFAQVPTGINATEEMGNDRDALWSVLERHRAVVLLDRYARKRERLAAAIACLGKGPFLAFCKFCRAIGKMQ